MKKFFLLINLLCVTFLLHAQQHVIYGHIYDSATGESLISANIYNPTSLKGTTSNEFGYYSLRLPDGRQTVSFSYVGYETTAITLKLASDTMIVVRLQPSAQLGEVLVTDNRPEVGIKSTRMGASNVPLDLVRNMPVLLCEPDVLKTIQALPGVQSGMTGTCGIHVRGGDPDQNLFLLDGMPLYNVNHAFGFMSVFQAEAIKNVDFYKSSFPARFGGRLSSIVDVRTKDGDMKKYYGSFSIGLLTSHLNFEGPIIKDKTSFIISARRSYFDWLIKPFVEGTKIAIYDITAKVNHKFSDKCRLYASFYNGNDIIATEDKNENVWGKWEEKREQKWGNTLASLRLNTVIAPRLFGNTTIAYTGYHSWITNYSYSKYYYDAFEGENIFSCTTMDSRFRSDIRDVSLLSDFDFSISDANLLKFGASACFHTFYPDVKTVRYNEETDESKVDSIHRITPGNINAKEIELYAEDEFKIGEALSANLGLHCSIYMAGGQTYTSAQPRASFSLSPEGNWRYKTAYSLMQQNIHMLSSSELSFPSDLWVPITKRIKPMMAHQFSMGTYYLGLREIELSAEIYYKKMNNVLEYKDGMTAMGSATNWEDKVEMGKGRSYGIELMAERKTGRLNGWINYTLGKSERWFPDGSINNGQRFPYKYDRRHTINITLNYQKSKRVDFHADWRFMSGAKTTAPVGQMSVMKPEQHGGAGIWWADPAEIYNDHSQWKWTLEMFNGRDYAQYYLDQELDFVYNGRNNYTLPAWHSLNLGVNFHKQKKHGERIWNFSVMNAYNHRNPDIVRLWQADSYCPKPYIDQITLMTVMPSVSYIFKF